MAYYTRMLSALSIFVSQNDKVQLQVWWIPDNQMKAAILGAQFVDKSYPTVEICASLV